MMESENIGTAQWIYLNIRFTFYCNYSALGYR
jgi:hypothetical protein